MVNNIDVKSPGNFQAVYLNYFDERTGVLVCNENFRIGDENSPNQRLCSSKILEQS
jgi:hypothetical protein